MTNGNKVGESLQDGGKLFNQGARVRRRRRQVEYFYISMQQKWAVRKYVQQIANPQMRIFCKCGNLRISNSSFVRTLNSANPQNKISLLLKVLSNDKGGYP